jgi:hypothetical protein
MYRAVKRINPQLLFEGQLVHVISLLLLLGLSGYAASLEGVMDGSFWGIPTKAWFVILLSDTIIHQCFVWFCWRMELHGRRLTKWLGDTQRAFRIYSIIFAFLFGARFVLVTILAIANRQSLDIESWTGYLLAAIVAVPAIYLFYSVKTYFSFRRAFGIDHFESDARNWSLVDGGIFKWTPNAMYVFGIGALWVPGLALQSSAALVGAAFSHAYIWVHYFTVEKPDMKHIYR